MILGFNQEEGENSSLKPEEFTTEEVGRDQ
jgi:hypothetical protein